MHWTKEDKKRLFEFHFQGKTDQEIAKILGRTSLAVTLKRNRMVRAGKVEKTRKPYTRRHEMPQNEIKIDKGIRVPGKQSNYGMDYPFDKMEVGDSFAIKKLPHRTLISQQQQLMANAKSYVLRRTLYWKFTSRKDEQKQQIRIWRIK